MSDKEQQTVWESTLDDRYRCLVSRTGAETGRLTITDTETEQELHAEDVELAYGATFGPDIGDIRTWQELAMEVVDSRRK